MNKDGISSNVYINTVPQPGTFIPIYLIDEFSSNIANNFATSVHGCVSGSVMNGINALFYLNDDNSMDRFGPIPFGTPFIVIPAGSIHSGNGINALVNANKLTKQGPTNFYQCLSLTLCHEVIEVLINPTGLSYFGSGDPLGLNERSKTSEKQIFYLKEAVNPFSHGKDNLFEYKHWTMTNFAYPAYFYPYNSSKVYDFLGHCVAPFTPYKGNQFVLYQEAKSELQVGNYISNISDPYNIQFISSGSIYEYSGWGLTQTEMENKITTNDLFLHNPMGASKKWKSSGTYKTNSKKHYKKINCGFYSGHNRNSLHFNHILENVNILECVRHKKIKARSRFNPKNPQLLPFQYIDDDGFLSCRFAIVNYSEKLKSSKINATIPVMEKYLRERYLPYWNIKPVIIKNYTIYNDKDLPVFDGTFIPLFILQVGQFNFNKLGGLVAPGGATNVNNVYNILAGPLITEYLQPYKNFNVPNLPLGNPYLMLSDANFTGAVTITTNKSNVGPFVGIPTGASSLLNTEFPITAQGAVASPDITACTNLAPNSMLGKIGVNIRTSNSCDSSVYPNNMANAGAIATITVYTETPQIFTATGSKVFGCTIGVVGYSLIEAIRDDPTIEITISEPVTTLSDINILTSILTHEMMELSSDPTYANYIASGNPPTDRSILFSQVEASDPVETLNVLETDCKKSYSMESFPNPSYFVANLSM